MKRWLPIYLTLLAVSSLGASTLDVSADTSVLVHSGDTLVFHLLTSNFSGNAARLGVSRSPSQLDFTLVSAPGVGPVEFAATLESTAGSLAFGDVIFHSGYFQGSGYSGEISTLQGRMELPPPLSETLFEASTTIVLALRNEGPDVRLGLAPYLLRQDLYASLSGGPLSVGAVPYLVDLESRTGLEQSISMVRAASGASIADVPEPGSGGWGVPHGRCSALKINHLHPLIHSDTIYMADRNPPLEVPQIHNGVTKSTE
jgi:hypothetical protein